MKKLSLAGQKWLKFFHVLSAGIWVGTSVSISSKIFFLAPSRDAELFGILSALDYIDICVLVPGAMGVLVTGSVYSIWTKWGWFRHRWVTVKWVICLFGIGFGTYPLGPWLTSLVRISGQYGLASFSDPLFLHDRAALLIFGTFQSLTIIFAFFVSVMKPWGRGKSAN